MAQCPHCGKELEIGPLPSVPWWKYDPGPGANLGCGTLILIAIIVAMFSGGSGTEREIERLQHSVQKVEQAVETLGRELRQRTAGAKNTVVP